jgi:hypothetical protein
MHQEDRFLTIAGSVALVLTVSAFVWVHRGSIFRPVVETPSVRQAETVLEVPPTRVPSPVSPELERATRSARISEPVGSPLEQPSAIQAAYRPGSEIDPSEPHLDHGTIQQVFGAVVSVAAGTSPELGADRLPPQGEVLVRRDRDDRLVVAPGTHRRYDGIVSALDAVDPDDALAAFDRLDILWNESNPDEGEFPAALVVAIDHLLEVDAPDVEPDMISRGTHWGFADTEFEAYSEAQKHILLMGRSNAARVRESLQAIRDLIAEPAAAPELQPDPPLDDEIFVAEVEQPEEITVVAAPK